MLGRVAEVARTLRESLKELGLEPPVQIAAETIPDVQNRLRYVATLTSQAASTALDNADKTQALMTNLRDLAIGAKMGDPESAAALADAVESAAPQIIEAQTNIVVAQGFQDLTGQVIHKLTALVERIDNELIRVLIQMIEEAGGRKSLETKKEEPGLLNGPAIDKTSDDTVHSQDDVDALLASLDL